MTLMINSPWTTLRSFCKPTTCLRLVQAGLITLFLALGILVSLTASEGPDEVAHFYFNRFVAKYGRLPLTEEERLEAGYKADLPPLYYLIAGAVGRVVELDSPPYLKISRDNPRLQLVTGVKNVKGWRLIKTEDPLEGEVLLWHIGRWVALACGLAGLIITYLLIRVSQPGFPWLALSATAVLAFLPTYRYISGVTSYEPLTGALMALYFLLLFFAVKTPARNWLYAGLGIVLGLAAATRQTVWVLIPMLPVTVLWLAYRHQWSRRTTLWRLFLVGVGLAVTFGLWMLYIAVYFNEVAELGWFQGLISPILIGDGSGRTSLQIAGIITGGDIGLSEVSRQSDPVWQWAWRFFTGIWGHGWLGWLLLAVWGAALIGLGRQWRRGDGPTRTWIALLISSVGLLFFFPIIRFLFSGEASTAMSQHILFPAGAAIILLLLIGLGSWLSPGQLTIFLLVLAAVYLSQGVRTVANTIDRNPGFPIQTVPLSANEQALATFEEISLLGYDYEADDQRLKITLIWRADEYSSEDYRVELTLVDGAGRAQARWVGQPLGGRYPTRAWMPEDRIRDVVYLPIGGLPAGDYQLELRLLGDQRVIISSEGETFSLDQLKLVPGPAAAAEALAVGDQELGYTLWQAGQPVQGPPLFQEHSPVVISTDRSWGNEITLEVVGPDGQGHRPVDHTGRTYIFEIEPNFADGDYRLRVEQMAGEEEAYQAETGPLFQVETEPRLFQIGPIAQPTSANFAGYVALLGYDLPQRRIEPGGVVPVTLYWQALRTIGANLVMFNHLIGEDQQIWGGRDRIAHESYSTMLWAPDEIVIDSFNVQVEPDAPDGIYYLLVGLYLPVGQAPVSLPLVEDGALSDVTSVRLGPLKVGKTPASLTVNDATPQVVLNQPFGDNANLTLLGYDLTEPAGVSEPALKLTLYWQVEAPLDKDYTTFVHWRNPAGETIAQRDQLPLQGEYPTSLWELGEIIADEIILPVPDKLPEAGYSVVAGLYELKTGQRLAVPGSPANEVILINVE